MSNPIPVARAQDVREESDCDFVVIVGWNNSGSAETASFGRTAKDKDNAAAMLSWLFKQMKGDPDALKNHNDHRAENARIAFAEEIIARFELDGDAPIRIASATELRVLAREDRPS